MFPYILTAAGALIKAFVDAVNGPSGVFLVISLAMAAIGIFMSIRDITDNSERIKQVLYHVAAWVVGYLIFTLIGIVLVLFVGALFLQFMGINVLGTVGNWLSNTLEAEEQPRQIVEEATSQPEKKVEVWRENGMMRENLKVSSDGERYYDPDDGEWHKIKK